MKSAPEILKEKCTPAGFERLMILANPKMHEFVAHYLELCNPDSVYVADDSEKNTAYIRSLALKADEERELAIEGHTIHFDGPGDQARDKARTKYLLPPGVDLGSRINSIEKAAGLKEVEDLLRDSMRGKEALILFFCLGPTFSGFSIPCVQITDSSYVAHSETILYRKGYDYFQSIGDAVDFFRFIHSAGRLEDNVSADVDGRRIYIDLEEDIVFSTNTQYAGNTIGLKKPALRLAIRRALRQGWLSEHMLLMGVHGPGERVTYFSGAFPSACGKTSTAMCAGETIVGDDIAYLRERGGRCFAANVEAGIFGIIRDVSRKDDPVIWDVLTTPGEVIFSNVLITDDGVPYWLGDGRETPERGTNFSGRWQKGKTDEEGKPIPCAHKNARYTVSLSRLSNRDPLGDDPNGVELGGILYGGRDSDTWVPVERAFDWNHGVITKGAAIESETTAATLGEEGVRKFNIMSNLDFLPVSLSDYVKKYLAFGERLSKPPVIFSVNYFLRGGDGEYLNGHEDKRVWLKWMELSINNDLEMIQSPTGYIPRYPDLKRLFREVLDKDYSEEDYIEQFKIRVPECLAKIERMLKIYNDEEVPPPEIFYRVFEEQKRRLEEARAEHGDYISPFSLFVGVGPT
ncbi:MAG: phosphoenolpyruvate carboxykinase (GTP) [Candidatus Euphemobacter frigidus]|nr:phosphoenolpyruvate carboxykinase (GTP) [Candidatus Euphemobacter frigidus]MDP8276698.1 phosphoenolpyruvate carboxykinase (GTP) [Candidatus Euphemobacter frigidus]